MCMSMACLHRDQHEQWKSHRENPSRRYYFSLVCMKSITNGFWGFMFLILQCISKVWRFFAANYLVIILSTQVSPQRRILSHRRLEVAFIFIVASLCSRLYYHSQPCLTKFTSDFQIMHFHVFQMLYQFKGSIDDLWPLVIQLRSAIGVVPGKGLNAVVVADKHYTAQRNIG